MYGTRNNLVRVSGKIVTEFKYSNEVLCEKFYNVEVESRRKSGVIDRIPVLVSERIMDVTLDYVGKYVVIEGEYRSYNQHSEDGTHLILNIFAEEVLILPDESIDSNSITLQGVICKKPNYRKTPFGREIADVLLAVNRSFGKADYIPCIFWGRNARFAERLDIGMAVKVSGRIQSRTYVKKYEDHEEEKTAYDVSISRMQVIDRGSPL